MSANTTPIFPLTPVIGVASLVTPTVITSRANITGTTGLTQLTPTSTNGKKVTLITLQSTGTSLAATLCVWLYNGTTSYLIDEIPIYTTTPGNTSPAFTTYRDYTTYWNSAIVLPPTYQLYVSITVQQNLTILAHGGDY
jgi:hypothetical protein